MKRADVTRMRSLLAELSAMLDALESELPREEKKPRARVLQMPAERARPEVVDQVRRSLRRRGVVA